MIYYCNDGINLGCRCCLASMGLFKCSDSHSGGANGMTSPGGTAVIMQAPNILLCAAYHRFGKIIITVRLYLLQHCLSTDNDGNNRYCTQYHSHRYSAPIAASTYLREYSKSQPFEVIFIALSLKYN